jgi:hypothetical protein
MTLPQFHDIPPFPNTVPTAPLLRISLAKLLVGDVEEEKRVWEASKGLGFFYLDLATDAGGSEDGHSDSSEGSGGDEVGKIDGVELLEQAEKLFGVGEEVFALPVEEKEKFDFKDKGSYFGYKGMGKGVVDKEGNRDRNEFYNVSPSFPPHNPWVGCGANVRTYSVWWANMYAIRYPKTPSSPSQTPSQPQLCWTNTTPSSLRS